MIYLELFWGFFTVSFFAFGGAYGAIPLIRDMVLSYGWISEDMLTYMIAVAESTPGPIIINLATYVGSSQGGFWGAVVATLAVVIPCFGVIVLIASIMKNAIKNKYVQAVLRGLKPCVVGIVLATGTYMVINNCLIRGVSIGIDVLALFITIILVAIKLIYQKVTKKNMSPILLIAISAVVGMIVYGI